MSDCTRDEITQIVTSIGTFTFWHSMQDFIIIIIIIFLQYLGAFHTHTYSVMQFCTHFILAFAYILFVHVFMHSIHCL